MRNLTAFQKNFILNTFFVRNDYDGWKNLGTKLIEKGECIVAGRTKIFNGGVGNFIKTEESEDYVDCIKYKFDLEEFLSSQLYKHTKESYLENLNDRLASLESEIKEVSEL